MTYLEALDILKGTADAFIDHWLDDDDRSEQIEAEIEQTRVKCAYKLLKEKLSD